MSKKTKYVDVNKEKYMRALLGEVAGHSKMVDFNSVEKLIVDFVSTHPASENTSDDLPRRNGKVIISSRKKKRK
jgi:hypothetical protein